MPHFHKLANIAALLLLSLLATTQMRAQSALDGFDPNANGAIRAVVVQPDGKILLGGDFTTLSPNGGAAVTRNHIARLNPDGTLDTAFNPDANNNVFSIAMQADGRILVAGYFTSIGGQTRNRIARLDATTGSADSFAPNVNEAVLSIAVQVDGKILAAGYFTTIGGQTRNYIARLDATSGVPDSFNPNANNTIRAIAVQVDGRILAGGDFGSIGGQARNRIARLDATTGLADSFDPNADNLVLAIAVQADGKILVGGEFFSIGGQTRNRIARLDATTGLADSFDPSANNVVYSIALQADGKILVGGVFNGVNSVGGQARNRIARLDATTGLADSFDPNANSSVISIAIQSDGKILAGGVFDSIGGNLRHNIARLETDGRIDQTLDLSATGNGILVTAVQPDGKILIGGGFTTVLGVARNKIARLNTDGTLDTAFNPNASGPSAYVDSIALQTDGKILAGGTFNSIGGKPRNDIARLDTTTGLADSFDPTAAGPNNTVRSIVVQADGRILVGGFFTSIGGQPRNNMARLDATTGLADSFDPNANGIVYSIAVQPDGKILVGGDLTGIGGQTRGRIARLDATTGLADSFDPNASLGVYSIAVQTDGKILAGGTFTSIGGQTRSRMARLDPTTALADSFDPNASGGGPMRPIYSIVLQADGRILVGGSFEFIGGQQRAHIARLDPSTGLADSFNPSADNQVLSIAVQADGKVLAGGYFNSMGGRLRNLFARLNNATAALQNLAVTQTTITWTRGGSSPQFTRVTFESSTDNMNYTPLGNGMAASSNWTLTGLNLPTRKNLYIRARGYYRSGQNNGSESITESVRNTFLIPPTFANISTRVRVETGDNAMIGGFIITGTEPKTVIVRGLGPSLSIPGALADPIIEVHGNSGELLASNDNWRDGLYAQQVASTLPPANDLESALYGRINPGTYTVIVRGKNDATGVGVFEVYDLEPTADSKLANVSTRGLVQMGDNVLIGGVIVRGQDPLRVIVRAIGPSLPVPGALADPTLELHDGNGALLVANDNWRSDQEAEIIATTIPPSNDLESAIVRDLAPGNYTAIVRGVNNTTGIAVVEAYALK